MTRLFALVSAGAYPARLTGCINQRPGDIKSNSVQVEMA